jgi:hypothetical protein
VAIEVGLGEQVLVAPHVERVVVRDRPVDVRQATERGSELGTAAAAAGAVAEAGPGARAGGQGVAEDRGVGEGRVRLRPQHGGGLGRAGVPDHFFHRLSLR